MQTIFTNILLIMSLTLMSCSYNNHSNTNQQANTTQQPATSSSHNGHNDNGLDSVPRTTITEADTLVNEGKAIIIDVRGIDAYNNAHIKGAILVALSNIEKGDFSQLDSISKDKHLIAYCS